jgi:bacteriocin biosynthesis cyclodehydratase domain-containing protein
MHHDRSLLLPPLLVTNDLTSTASIPGRPALAPWYRAVEDKRRVLFEHGGTVVTFEGRAARILLPKLLPLLDGTRTTAEITDALGAAIAPSVDKALALLAANGLLIAGDDVDSEDPSADQAAAEAAAFAAAVTRRTTPRAARRALESSEVRVLGCSPNAEEITRLLGASGVGVKATTFGDDPPPESFVIAAPDRGEVRHLDDLNLQQLEHGAAWLQVLPNDGRFSIIGPVFLPGSSACRACFLARRGACSDYEDDFQLLDSVPTRAATPTALSAVGAGLATTLAVRWLATQDPSLPGRFYAVEPGVVVGLSYHHVLRVPRCRACGPVETAMPSPWFREAI